MASIERSRTIPAQPEQVWAALAALDEISGWASNVDHSSYLTERSEGVGAVRRVQAGDLTLVERVVDWDPQVALAYEIEGLPLVESAVSRWELTPSGEGTAVSITTIVERASGLAGRLSAPIIRRKLAQGSEAMLAGLECSLGA